MSLFGNNKEEEIPTARAIEQDAINIAKDYPGVAGSLVDLGKGQQFVKPLETTKPTLEHPKGKTEYTG
jgi:hypothetical protein